MDVAYSFENFKWKSELRGHFVGNKAKGRISKRVFQENKARQIFRKNEHFYASTTGGNPVGFSGIILPKVN